MGRAKAGISALETYTDDPDSVPWVTWMLDSIRTLWEEEAMVAAAVAKSVQEEVQF